MINFQEQPFRLVRMTKRQLDNLTDELLKYFEIPILTSAGDSLAYHHYLFVPEGTSKGKVERMKLFVDGYVAHASL